MFKGTLNLHQHPDSCEDETRGTYRYSMVQPLHQTCPPEIFIRINCLMFKLITIGMSYRGHDIVMYDSFTAYNLKQKHFSKTFIAIVTIIQNKHSVIGRNVKA